jgi:hypothetical protein
VYENANDTGFHSYEQFQRFFMQACPAGRAFPQKRDFEAILTTFFYIRVREREREREFEFTRDCRIKYNNAIGRGMSIEFIRANSCIFVVKFCGLKSDAP